MKLIIGLGNPGNNHTTTRHNAGFLCLDFLQKAWGCDTFQVDHKMSALVSKGQIGKHQILLVKPTTFMNASGTAVSQLIHFYKLSPEDIVVIHDDLDIAPGTYKTTTSSRAAGHNGVSDIIEKIGTQDYCRIRLGIGRPATLPSACRSAHDFVLEKFTPEELSALAALFPAVKDELLKWLA